MIARKDDISRGDWTRGAKLPKRTSTPVGSPRGATQSERSHTMTIPAQAAVMIARDLAAKLGELCR